MLAQLEKKKSSKKSKAAMLQALKDKVESRKGKEVAKFELAGDISGSLSVSPRKKSDAGLKKTGRKQSSGAIQRMPSGRRPSAANAIADPKSVSPASALSGCCALSAVFGFSITNCILCKNNIHRCMLRHPPRSPSPLRLQTNGVLLLQESAGLARVPFRHSCKSKKTNSKRCKQSSCNWALNSSQ